MISPNKRKNKYPNILNLIFSTHNYNLFLNFYLERCEISMTLAGALEHAMNKISRQNIIFHE